MSHAMPVTLSTQPAAAQWGENALISFVGGTATIHLKETANSLLEREQLLRIQRAARRLDSQGICEVQLSGDNWHLEQQWAFAQGFANPKRESGISWAKNTPAAELSELEARYTAADWVREVTNLTPEELPPMQLASQAADFIHALAPEAVSYNLLVGEELEEAGWVGVYGVGRGSERPPVILELDYNPTGNPDAPVAAALVGKGITFDSGGYSIKSSQGMVSMKCDMGGAAMVTGGLALAISRGLDCRVKLILCCAENLISGHAYKLGDILTYRNGVSVEIVNTDAEGRLALADGLIMAGETGAPLILDAATLTGAAVVALGEDYNAVFSLDDELSHKILTYATQEQEPAWPLPLEPWHQDNCPSPFADTANSRAVKGGGFGGASNAAGFLSRFVPNGGKGWVHLDLASVYRESATSAWAAGATALGIRTIARVLCEETAAN